MDHELPEFITVPGFLLRRLSGADTGELLEHFSDLEVTEHLDFEPLTSREDAEEIVAWADRLHATARGIRWTVRTDDTLDFVGTCGFNSIVRDHGSRGEIAYDLCRVYWGRGVMRSVMPCLLATGFRRLGLHRLQAFVTPGNVRSVRLLERHGFRHEGRLRGYGQWRGTLWDQDLFALLEPEWPEAAAPGSRIS